MEHQQRRAGFAATSVLAAMLLYGMLTCHAQQNNGDVSSIITRDIFNQFLPKRHIGAANGVYTYPMFIEAANAFNGFGTTGTDHARRHELAAFFAHVAHETGYGEFTEEITNSNDPRCQGEPCDPTQRYYGRGPLQLTWNYNYLAAGRDLGFDGIHNPGIVATNPHISFKTAVWFWMTQSTLTCHDAMVDHHGFGATIKAINSIECEGNAQNIRIEIYKHYCNILGVQATKNLSC